MSNIINQIDIDLLVELRNGIQNDVRFSPEPAFTQEQLDDLIALIHRLNDTAASIEGGWLQATTGDTEPIETLWDGVPDSEMRVETPCKWAESPQFDDDAWMSECGMTFVFYSDGPIENNFKSRPKCGRRIIVNGGAK